MKKFLAYLLLLTLVFVGFACGEKEDVKTPEQPDVPTAEEPTPEDPTVPVEPTPEDPTVPVEPTPEDPTEPEVPVEKPVLPADFAIELSGVEKVYVDETKKTTLTHTPEEFTAEYTASYSSSDEEVLYVNPETGAVQGKKAGTATVTAVVVGLNDAGEEVSVKDELVVTVEERPALEGITLEASEKIQLESSTNVKVVAIPEGAVANVTWKSSDDAIATVSDKGIVTAKGLGEVVITATQVDNEAITYSVTITVEPKPDAGAKPTSITITGQEEATAGYPVEFKATVYPANANQNVIWTSSNPDILSIDENGKGTPLKTGVARIRAISAVDEKVKSALFKVTVKEEDIVEIPDMKGYKIVIMNASSALGDLDPFLDTYTQADKMYKQAAWLEVEKLFNCDISVEAYPDSAPWGPARIQYIIDNAATGTSTADLSVVSNLWLYKFANSSANAAVDVTDLYVKYGRNQMPTALREASSYQGKIYCASTGISATDTYVDLGLFYNMAWVEKLGVKDPATMFNDGEWNYTGFKAWCQEVQAKLNVENGEFAIGGHPFYYWLGMTNSAGVKVADSMSLNVNLDSQRSKDATNVIYQLVQAGAVDTVYSWAENDGGFMAGTTVMSTGFLWFVRNQSRWSGTMFGDDTRYGYVPFPYPDDLNKEDARISQSEISLLMYTAGREAAYPAGVTLENVYYAMTEMYLRTIKNQENDPTFSAESVVYQSLSKRIDNPESIEAIRHFTSARVFFDPAHGIYSSTSATVLKAPAINVMTKGNDYQQEFDAVRESYETLFKSIYA